MSQDVEVFVLNFNGSELLARCLPSVLRACQASRHRPRLVVIDNSSTDESVRLLQTLPDVRIKHCINRGLCSFNDALAESSCRVAVLLNNDIQLAADSLEALTAPLLEQAPALEHAADRRLATQAGPYFLTAAQCWKTDGGGYDGQKTAVAWRWGLIQATSQFPGHQRGIFAPGRTASAGAAVAVDRRRFLALGGFDELYLPGRLEDVDLAYRAYQAGLRCLYVPDAVAWHVGMGSFGPVYGAAGNDHLALRNTLLFQWRHLRHPLNRVRQAAGFLARGLADVALAPLQPKPRRWRFFRAWRAAARRWQEQSAGSTARRSPAPAASLEREWEFFREYHPRTISVEAACWLAADANLNGWRVESHAYPTESRFSAIDANGGTVEVAQI